MAGETDGIQEELAAKLRMLIMAASQAGERLLGQRQAAARQAAGRDALATRQLQARLQAEHAAAAAVYRRVGHPEWWQTATPQGIATAYTLAGAWRDQPDAAQAQDTIRHQLHDRYGITLTGQGQADPAEVARQITVAQQQTASRTTRVRTQAEVAEATQAVAGAAATDTAQQQETAPVDQAGATVRRPPQAPTSAAAYDSPQRRAATAETIANVPGMTAELAAGVMAADACFTEPGPMLSPRPPHAGRPRSHPGLEAGVETERSLGR